MKMLVFSSSGDSPAEPGPSGATACRTQECDGVGVFSGTLHCQRDNNHDVSIAMPVYLWVANLAHCRVLLLQPPPTHTHTPY